MGNPMSNPTSNPMFIPINATTESRDVLDRLLGELRPKLHRYCARMTGSVIDGEDVIQEAMLKAIEAFPQAGPIANVEGLAVSYRPQRGPGLFCADASDATRFAPMRTRT